jgi:hypothetical protein
LSLIPALALSLAAEAADIYKCSGGGRYVAYQNYPCPEGLEQTLMADASRSAPPAYPVSPASGAAAAGQQAGPGQGQVLQTPQAAQVARYGRETQTPETQARETQALRNKGEGRLPFGRTILNLGMSDDEVLNLPRWGIPDRISRTKVNGVWHEDWIYARGDVPRHLHFQNAVLTSIDTDYAGPPQQFASASLR